MTFKITRGVLTFLVIMLALIAISLTVANVGRSEQKRVKAAPVTQRMPRARTIFLRSQDIVVFGGVQCIANAEAGVRHMLCSKRPRSRALYDVAIFPRHVTVYRMGEPDNPLFSSRP